MTIETEFYFTRKLMKKGKKQRHLNQWRPLHTDFINKRFKVTYVNGSDNPQQTESQKAEFILTELLLGKLQNDTITQSQLRTLIRLEHGFELTQTTRDKILIAIQGVIGSLRDRIKAAFNL